MKSLQDTYGENGTCFGCGPKNDKGLQIKSFQEGDKYICKYRPREEHQAFPGVINGGIIGAIFDCHGNWTAAHTLFLRDPDKPFPSTVTITFSVILKRPTPFGEELLVTTEVENIEGNKVAVKGNMMAGEKETASFTGVFYKVEEGHPAFHRWD
jgi:hypothetical protein